MKKNFFLILTIYFFAVVSVYGDKWQIVGPRAMGMGGAGVASCYGSDGQYWNPASLAEDKEQPGDFLLSFGADIEATEKMLTVIDKLSNMSDKYKDLSDKIKDADHASAHGTERRRLPGRRL